MAVQPERRDEYPPSPFASKSGKVSTCPKGKMQLQWLALGYRSTKACTGTAAGHLKPCPHTQLLHKEERGQPLLTIPTDFPAWLTAWMEACQIPLWGAADLREFATPVDQDGSRFPSALSFAIPMDPQIMASIQNGPNQAYADDYARVNEHINTLSAALAAKIKERGFRASPLAASERTDAVKIVGDFPHKTAATRAGLGWVGRHCQLVTHSFGPWVRLGTVFADLELSCGPPIEQDYCGGCKRCVEACPAQALTGNTWIPGRAREEILDAWACDQWKKDHYYQYHKGHNCGICAAVCPYGLRTLRRGCLVEEKEG